MPTLRGMEESGPDRKQSAHRRGHRASGITVTRNHLRNVLPPGPDLTVTWNHLCNALPHRRSLTVRP